jgi:hypothetical protein
MENMNETNDMPHKEEMDTLVECINVLRKRAYKHNFTATKEDTILDDEKKEYKPDQVKISSFYRFEGESDPGDSAILYAIETSSGEKGIIINSYGPTSDTKVTKFIEKVEDIQKKEHS